MAYKTFKDLYTSVMGSAKIPLDDTDSLELVKQYINNRNDEISETKTRRWNRDRRSIKIPAKYEAGTMSVTNGDRTITGSGTNFTEDFVDRMFHVIGTDEHYNIVGVDTVSQNLILSVEYIGDTDATAEYVIYKHMVGLFPDLAKIESITVDNIYAPLKPVSPTYLTERYTRYKDLDGYPVCYTQTGYSTYSGPPLGQFLLGYDFAGNGPVESIRLFPAIVDKDYILNIEYGKQSQKLIKDDDEPILPFDYRVLLYYGALADAFLLLHRNESVSDRYERKFDDKVKQLSNDERQVDDKALLMVKNRWRSSSSDDYAGQHWYEIRT